MHPSICDLCDNPAIIHETATRGGVVKVRHLCRAHGLKIWRDSLVPAIEHLASTSNKHSAKSFATIPPTEFRRDR